jgi:uncharacterized protein YprB with RNaseH-like and TPR domain
MLQNSFVHLPGIGPETESRFWSEGLHTWDQLMANAGQVFSSKRAAQIISALEEARLAFESSEYSYFQGRLKGSEMWRVLPSMLEHCPRKIAYLDIETTGLGFPPQCKSTTIAVLYGGELFLEHDKRKQKRLLEELEAEAKGLVTFNGGTFDLPFLRREFQLELRQAHVDLRFWLAKLGHRGGLKKVQTQFPEVRQRESMDIDGYDAVRLWRLHERGVPNALETLLTYNAEDTVVLEQLVCCGLNLEAEARPHLKMKLQAMPAARSIPHEVCPLVYRMLRAI